MKIARALIIVAVGWSVSIGSGDNTRPPLIRSISEGQRLQGDSG
jgi:hypothetical protein